tara:strand:+ start:398 stop:622 length:225 start_codon:yes stop_codon:yes gene_type:complete
MFNISDKHSTDEVDYFTNFEGLEVNTEGTDSIYELYDDSDDTIAEKDYLDISKFCLDLESIEILDDNQFNYMEV